MTKRQLIGTWKLDGYEEWFHLHADGYAVWEIFTPGAGSARQEATWEFVSPKRWRLRLPIEPQPPGPGLKDGAVEVIDYRIVASAEDHMTCTKFDYEGAFEYTRLTADAA